MRQRLLRLVVVGPVISVALAGVLLIFTLNFARSTIRDASITSQLSGVGYDSCRAAPKTWGWRSGHFAVFGYDEFGRSANPDAPPIEPELLQRALASGHVVHRATPEAVTWVASFGETGPCAVLRGSQKNPESATAPRFLGVIATAITGGMLLAAAGTFWFVVIPLRRRIDGLAVAARAVGGPSFAPPPAGPDALGHIADVLTRSHGRLVETRETLEQRNRALEDHLAGIAHDLRTPLSSMHLALEAVADASDGGLQHEARRALADVVYLSSMVENLHQATRLRHEVEVTSSRVGLCDLVRRLEKRFAIVGRHAGIQVAANTPDAEIWVACTHALAERAIANLVQNAVEHNTAPGHVAIRLTAGEGRFALSVVDDGPGLPEETLATLQRETFLVDDARPRGPGMGRLITAEVARRAGWSLTYRARASNGLEVRLEGAVVDAPQPQRQSHVQPAPPLS